MGFITPGEADDLSGNEGSKSRSEGDFLGRDSESTYGPREQGLERRGSPRHSDKREARLLFTASPPAMEGGHSARKLIGYTRDISETGLSLTVSSAHVGGYNLFEVGGLMVVKLSLPSGVVEMYAEVVHSGRPGDNDAGAGSMVGVIITGMADEARYRYREYLTALASRERM